MVDPPVQPVFVAVIVILPAFFGSSLKEALPPEPVFLDSAVRPAPLTLTVTPEMAWLRASLVVTVTVLVTLWLLVGNRRRPPRVTRRRPVPATVAAVP